MDDERPRFTIGHLSRRTGLPVRTIRYWSDIGAVPPVERSSTGYRLYDAESLARLELVRTLRDLGLGLDDVRRVLAAEATVADVAAAHVAAIDAQIRVLRLRRAVLDVVVRRRADTEEMTLMNRLATLSAEERRTIIRDFVDEVFADLDADPELADRMRGALPDLPDEPTPEQVDAWVELAELVQDRDFRTRIRNMAERSARDRTEQEQEPGRAAWFAGRVVELAGGARERGVPPESAEAGAILDELLGNRAGDPARAGTLERLEAGTDPRAERYWQLLAVINDWPQWEPHVPAFEWLIAALRAHG